MRAAPRLAHCPPLKSVSGRKDTNVHGAAPDVAKESDVDMMRVAWRLCQDGGDDDDGRSTISSLSSRVKVWVVMIVEVLVCKLCGSTCDEKSYPACSISAM